MKYTKDQRLDIGRRIYDNEMTRYEVAAKTDSRDGAVCAADLGREPHLKE